VYQLDADFAPLRTGIATLEIITGPDTGPEDGRPDLLAIRADFTEFDASIDELRSGDGSSGRSWSSGTAPPPPSRRP